MPEDTTDPTDPPIPAAMTRNTKDPALGRDVS